MLNIHNVSKLINKFIHNDNCFNTNESVRNDNHSNTNEFVHDDDQFNAKYFRYEKRSYDFKKASILIIQLSSTFIAVVMFLYIIFQQFASLFMSNETTIANLYFDQMIMSLISSSYNEIAFYETFELFVDLNHAQIFNFFNLSMLLTNFV